MGQFEIHTSEKKHLKWHWAVLEGMPVIGNLS